MKSIKLIIIAIELFISSGAYAQLETSMKGSIQLTIGYTDSLNQFISLNKGAAILLSTDDGPSDTISIVQIQDGNVSFSEIEPGSYLAAFYSEEVHSTPNGEEIFFLPTFLPGTLRWQEADTIYLAEDFADTIFLRPANSIEGRPTGPGVVKGEIQSNFDFRRLEINRGVYLTYLPADEDITEDGFLFYTKTNDKGFFEFLDLPIGSYTIEASLPMLPMDSNSFVSFELLEDCPFIEELIFTAYTDQITVEQLGFPIQSSSPCISEVGELPVLMMPNPADQVMNISLSEPYNKQLRYQLTDLSGKVFRQQTINNDNQGNFTIDTREVPEGCYLLRVYDLTEASRISQTLKVLIQH